MRIADQDEARDVIRIDRVQQRGGVESAGSEQDHSSTDGESAHCRTGAGAVHERAGGEHDWTRVLGLRRDDIHICGITEWTQRGVVERSEPVVLPPEDTFRAARRAAGVQHVDVIAGSTPRRNRWARAFGAGDFGELIWNPEPPFHARNI